MALKTLIGELHRRSLWQVVVGYLVFVWLLFETFEMLSTTVGLPDWVEPTAAVILIVLALSTTKALLVAGYYMHLKTDRRLLGLIMLAPLVMVALVVAFLYSSLLVRL